MAHSVGAILLQSVPETIISSDWLGLARQRDRQVGVEPEKLGSTTHKSD